MSKVKIQGNASGTGTFTIQAPNSNSDRVLSLPDGAGELLTTTGDGSQLTGITTGKVLQVVQVDFDNETNTNSSSYTAISQSASITPSSTSSKILIFYAGNVQCTFNGVVGEAFVGVFKDSDSTPLASTRFEWNVLNRSTFTCGINYLDSPSTTSSVTYSIKGRTTTGVLKFNDGGEDQGSSITLMEIGA